MSNQSITGAPPQGARNPLGTSGFMLAAAGLVVLCGMIGGIEWMSWDERASWERQHALRPGTPVAQSPPVAQALLFVAGLGTGGLASLVGLGLSVAGLRRRPRAPASWGLTLSLFSLILVVGWCLARHSEVRLG